MDRDTRADVIHKVFTGVNTDDYTLVANTLASYERECSNAGHLRGFVIGLVIGAIIGVMIAGLPSCGEAPTQDPIHPALLTPLQVRPSALRASE